jgi:hypothetical protein
MTKIRQAELLKEAALRDFFSKRSERAMSMLEYGAEVRG